MNTLVNELDGFSLDKLSDVFDISSRATSDTTPPPGVSPNAALLESVELAAGSKYVGVGYISFDKLTTSTIQMRCRSFEPPRLPIMPPVTKHTSDNNAVWYSNRKSEIRECRESGACSSSPCQEHVPDITCDICLTVRYNIVTTSGAAGISRLCPERKCRFICDECETDEPAFAYFKCVTAPDNMWCERHAPADSDNVKQAIQDYNLSVLNKYTRELGETA